LLNGRGFFLPIGYNSERKISKSEATKYLKTLPKTQNYCPDSRKNVKNTVQSVFQKHILSGNFGSTKKPFQ
jgi:hypothetical protein